LGLDPQPSPSFHPVAISEQQELLSAALNATAHGQVRNAECSFSGPFGFWLPMKMQLIENGSIANTQANLFDTQ
jgi:hypothetical protein